MKNTILVTLLLISVNVFGQVNDPGFTPKRDTAELRRILGGGTVTLLPRTQTIEVYSEQEAKSDTVMCLMLVTDTAMTGRTYKRLVMPDKVGFGLISLKDTTYYEQDLSVKTIIGYRVIEKTLDWESWHLKYEYLDDKKQPLSKSIIVWQTVNKK